MKTLDVRTLNELDYGKGDFVKDSKYVMSLAFAPQGKLAATGNIDGVVSVFDTDTRKLLAQLPNHGQAVRALTFSKSNQSLISAGDDLHIFVTDV